MPHCHQNKIKHINGTYFSHIINYTQQKMGRKINHYKQTQEDRNAISMLLNLLYIFYMSFIKINMIDDIF